MVPISADHPAHAVDGQLLPRLVPDVLPARNFFQDEETDFIAGIQKMPGLRVVRRANNVALQLVPENLRVAALNASWHRLTDPWECLVPIKPSQLDDLTVEFKAVIGELGFAETESAGILVKDLRSVTQANSGRIQIPFFKFPEIDSGEMLKPQRMGQRFARRAGRRHLLRGLRNYTLTVEQIDIND